MTLTQVNDHLQRILTDIGLSRTALTDQANFTLDLGLDSLDVTDLMLQVETSLGIRIPDEDWGQLQTIGQLKAYLAKEVVLDGSQLA